LESASKVPHGALRRPIFGPNSVNFSGELTELNCRKSFLLQYIQLSQ
jgi:hypothetical protein